MVRFECSGAGTVHDMYGVAYASPFNDIKNDYTDTTVVKSADGKSYTFTTYRKLVTGDIAGKDFVFDATSCKNKSLKFMWAANISTSFLSKHTGTGGFLFPVTSDCKTTTPAATTTPTKPAATTTTNTPTKPATTDIPTTVTPTKATTTKPAEKSADDLKSATAFIATGAAVGAYIDL